MKQLDAESLQALCAQAADSPRQRAHLLWHADHGDAVQRLVMAMQPGTYVRPHRHANPDKWETLLALRGRVALITFDDAGRVTERIELAPQTGLRAVELPAATWHTLVALERDSVLFEVKPGPYAPQEFAEWAPAEGDASAPAAEAWLRAAAPGARLGA
jgi:cupin fold WbuC family metalloprotein